MSGAARMRLRGPHSIFTILGVTDLAVNSISASEEDVVWTPAPNAVATQLRYRQAGTGAWSDWFDFGDSGLLITLDDRTNYQFQLRELDVAGKVGPRSNVVLYETIGPRLVIKDYKFQTALSTTAGAVPDCNLSTMGLSFGAGDRVLIWGFYQHAAVTNSITTAGAATGWTELALNVNGAVGVLQVACRVLEKNVDGTETTVDVFDDANVTTANHRVAYIALSLTPANGMLASGMTANAQATQGNPTPQTITSGDANSPAIAWSCAFGQSASADETSATGLTFTGYSGTQVFDFVVANIGGTIPLAARLMMKHWPNGEIPVNITTDTGDQGNNALMSGYHLVNAV